MKNLQIILVLMTVFGSVVFVGCGSDTDTEATGTDNDLADVSRILVPEKSFTLDDYVAAAWKKSKQYDTETVP